MDRVSQVVCVCVCACVDACKIRNAYVLVNDSGVIPVTSISVHFYQLYQFYF